MSSSNAGSWATRARSGAYIPDVRIATTTRPTCRVHPTALFSASTGSCPWRSWLTCVTKGPVAPLSLPRDLRKPMTARFWPVNWIKPRTACPSPGPTATASPISSTALPCGRTRWWVIHRNAAWLSWVKVVRSASPSCTNAVHYPWVTSSRWETSNGCPARTSSATSPTTHGSAPSACTWNRSAMRRNSSPPWTTPATGTNRWQ